MRSRKLTFEKFKTRLLRGEGSGAKYLISPEMKGRRKRVGVLEGRNLHNRKHILKGERRKSTRKKEKGLLK